MCKAREGPYGPLDGNPSSAVTGERRDHTKWAHTESFEMLDAFKVQLLSRNPRERNDIINALRRGASLKQPQQNDRDSCDSKDTSKQG